MLLRHSHRARPHAPGRRRAPADYTQRGTKLRLFTILAAVLVAVTVAERAFLWQAGGGPDGAGRPDPAAVGEDRKPGDQEQAAVADLDALRAAVANGPIEDDTVLRPAEREIWFRALSHLRDADPAVLRRRARPVAYRQLFQQPAVYRGQVVTVEGTVRLAYREQAVANDAGIEQYFVYVIQPAGSPDSPLVVYALQAPAGFPPIKDRDRDAATTPLAEEVSVTGIFFKRWAYAAKEGVQTAPLILARVPQRRLAIAAAAGQPAPLPPGEAPAIAAPVRPLADPREILERYDIGPARLAALADGQPLTAAEDELLVKLLYRLPRIGLAQLQAWRQTEVTWDELAAAPGGHRAAVFQLRGKVRRVEQRELPAEEAEQFELAHYYRVALDLDESPWHAVVYCCAVPAAWQLDAPLDEPAAADGLFFKLGDAADGRETLIFAAGRLAWLPQRSDAAHGIGPSHVALSALGMDAGLWADVRAANRSPLGDADREAFYQLLAAVGRASAGELKADWSRQLDLVPLLQSPQDYQGKILPAQGRTQRITRVVVPDPDVQSRFGVDHYYEIDLLLPLGEQSLRFGKEQGEDQGPVFRNNFPATLIVRELPPGLAEGTDVRQTIRADAVFFKIWTYHSAYTARFGQVQPAPLFVAAAPRLVSEEAPVTWFSNVLLPALFGVALAVLGIILWWSSRSASPSARTKSGERVQPPPDFSNLA